MMAGQKTSFFCASGVPGHGGKKFSAVHLRRFRLLVHTPCACHVLSTMPKLDLSTIAVRHGSNYPAEYAAQLGPRMRQRLGDAAGLTQFGVNRLALPPGAWSSQRHWHSVEDEFVCVLAGEVVLVTDAGEELLRAGDCAAFPANTPNGHHLVNRSDGLVVCLEVGGRSALDRVVYPDIDMVCAPGRDGYQHRDGTPYPAA
jgi:uncharacterized cupin superfamily protein